MESSKVYVDVVARFDKDGVMMPMAFVWEDGRKYEIDKVKSKERCASRKAGGTGIMYTVVVVGKECHLYFEFDKWFMERKFPIQNQGEVGVDPIVLVQNDEGDFDR